MESVRHVQDEELCSRHVPYDLGTRDGSGGATCEELPGVEHVVEEGADCACVGHLLLSGMNLGVCSCAVEEHAGAQWEG